MSAGALSNIESLLAAQGIAVSPSPIPAELGAWLTLSLEPGGPKQREPGLSPTCRELTAPESYLLLCLQHGVGLEAFKLAVKELVARGALEYRRVEKERTPGWTTRRALLCDGPRKNAVAQPALLPILELYDAMDKRSFVPGGRVTIEGGKEITGVPIERFARAATNRRLNYRDDCIVPLLVDRGLVRLRGYKHVLSRTREATRTPEGRVARDELDVVTENGSERLRALLEADPSRALEYARATGPALLLMDDVASELASLPQYAPQGGSELDFAALEHVDLSVFDYISHIGKMAGPGGGGGG